jgi:endonuclease/exonuclease/phosphatase family metal-dependent hydrolase
MTEITIASVNGEWMNNWFTGDDEAAEFGQTFFIDGERGDTAEAAGRLAALITSLDADIIALMEAPSRAGELELFVDKYLSDAGYRFILGDSGGAQKLALLFRPNVAPFELAPGDDAHIAELVTPWDADVDGDAVLGQYRFTRTPLVARASVGGIALELIVTHLKSNFINQGKERWQNPDSRLDFIKDSLKNRRRIATEAMHLRAYLDSRLAEQPDAAIVVLGDLNDGPGQDFFERFYLAHNVTDILAGSPYEPERVFHDAPADVPAEQRFSAVFDDFVEDVPDRRLLLDHILLSPAFSVSSSPLTRLPGTGQIAHEAWEAQVTGDGGRRDQRPTDHRPATVKVSVNH